MEHCKEGLKLVQEASHENIIEYNVNIENIYYYFIKLQKPLVDAIITKINDDIDKITALNNEIDEDNNNPKLFYLADRASTNKRCLFAYL